MLFKGQLYSKSKVWKPFMIGRYSDIKGPNRLVTTEPSNCRGVCIISPKITFMRMDKVNKTEFNETCKLNTLKYQGELTILDEFFC